MIVNYNSNPVDAKHYDTERLRAEFLYQDLFADDDVRMVYSHIDRIVAIGVNAKDKALSLDEFVDKKSFGTEFFLQRRELGMINLGGKVEVTTKQSSFVLDYLDALYLGKGEEEIVFKPLDENKVASLYCLSAPAHQSYPSQKITYDQARKVQLGTQENANARVINQYLHPDVLTTCQLCMGVTQLAEGSVWNTMPAHTHSRRMEAYLYFDIKPDQVVFHYMGEPQETRHLVVRNKQMVLSPSWSIHSGCGTQNYSFIWGMLGENQTFDDMDHIKMDQLI